MTRLLLGLGFLDELWSGVPMVGAADLQATFRSSYAAITVALLVAPMVAGMLLEPPLLWLAGRRSRRAFLAGGLGVQAAANLAAALASTLVVMGAALAVAGLAAGVVLGLGKATLMDTHPGDGDRVLSRFSLLGQLGDLAAPLLVGVVTSTRLGWRGGFLVAAALSAAFALALARRPLPGESATEEGAARRPLREVVRNRRLLAWLAATALCTLLDEIFVVLATLHLRDGLGLGGPARAAALGGFVGGAVVGLLVLDRLLSRISARQALVYASAGCAVLLTAWVLAPAPWLAAALMPLLGAATAPLYPLCLAQAYRALPDDTAAVSAAGALFTPLDILFPIVLAAVADGAGLRVALLLLLAQPLGVLIVASRREGG